jgi:hypothetical protein
MNAASVTARRLASEPRDRCDHRPDKRGGRPGAESQSGRRLRRKQGVRLYERNYDVWVHDPAGSARRGTLRAPDKIWSGQLQAHLAIQHTIFWFPQTASTVPTTGLDNSTEQSGA